MPKYNRRYRRRRPNFKRRGTSYMGLARKAFKLASYVAGVINVEKKFVETYQSGTFSTPVIYPLTLLAQGDQETERNGNSVRAKSVSIKGECTINTGATVPNTIRIILFIDKVSNGVIPAISELLYNGTTPATLAHYESDFMGSRFKILKDYHVTLTNNIREESQFSFYHRLNHHLKFDGVTAIQANLISGHLYIAVMSDASANDPTVKFSSIVRYIDN